MSKKSVKPTLFLSFFNTSPRRTQHEKFFVLFFVTYRCLDIKYVHVRVTCINSIVLAIVVVTTMLLVLDRFPRSSLWSRPCKLERRLLFVQFLQNRLLSIQSPSQRIFWQKSSCILYQIHVLQLNQLQEHTGCFFLLVRPKKWQSVKLHSKSHPKISEFL